MIAYWTLFNALNTCVKVMAPIIPFMTESIWQNLTRRVLPSAELSVHLSDWPTVLEGFEDDGIIEGTAYAREIIATALKLRNEHQMKVRQPLSKLFVCCDTAKAENVKVYEKNILDELNIKALEYITDSSVLKDSYLTVNFKVAGAVLKGDVNKMKQALEAATAEEMAAYTAKALAGEEVLVNGFEAAYDPAIFTIMQKTKAGIVSAEFGEDTIALDVVLTDELIKEGTVRDVVRQCQLIRKEAGYEVEQRVVMAISGGSEYVMATLAENKAYMMNELLADDIIFGGEIEADLTKTFEVGDSEVTLSVKKA